MFFKILWNTWVFKSRMMNKNERFVQGAMPRWDWEDLWWSNVDLVDSFKSQWAYFGYTFQLCNTRATKEGRSSYPLDDSLGIVSQPSIYFRWHSSRNLMSQLSSNIPQGLPNFLSNQPLRWTEQVILKPKCNVHLGKVTGHPVPGLLHCVTFTIYQRGIYGALQKTRSPSTNHVTLPLFTICQLNMSVIISHLELGIREPCDPKQQWRAHGGRRGCKPAIDQQYGVSLTIAPTRFIQWEYRSKSGAVTSQNHRTRLCPARSRWSWRPRRAQLRPLQATHKQVVRIKTQEHRTS